MRNVSNRFFFSSRRRHTRCGRDWSSDVCSPISWALAIIIGVMLTWATATAVAAVSAGTTTVFKSTQGEPAFLSYELDRLFRSEPRPERSDPEARSEERRVGKECRTRWDVKPERK